MDFLVNQMISQHKLSCILSQHQVRYPRAVERLVDASPVFLLLHTSLFESLFIHPCTMPSGCYHTWFIAYIDSLSLFADLFASSCRTVSMLVHLLFCWSLFNHLPHPTLQGPRRLLIFIAHRTSFLVRLLPCEDCSICPVVPFRRNIVAWNSLVCLKVGFFIWSLSLKRFHFDQKRRCSWCCSFLELFDSFP